MNPLTNMRNLNKMNERELAQGISGGSGKSWHDKYRESAWVYIGGLEYSLTEGDIICVFSQLALLILWYGEVVNINLVRDKKTGKSKGFCFLCYEDQRSTVLAVDNFNGIKIAGRIIRVDHVEEYKVPKEKGDETSETKNLWAQGCAPKPIEIFVKKEKKLKKKDKRRMEEELLPLDESDLPELARKRIKKEKKKAKKRERRERERGDVTSKDGDRSPVSSSSEEEDNQQKGSYYSDNFIKREGDASTSTADRDRTNSKWVHQSADKAIRKTKTEEGEEVPEHRVTMNYFESVLIKDRYMKADPQKQTHTDWREQEIMKMERDREKRLAGEEKPKTKDSYIPSRFK